MRRLFLFLLIFFVIISLAQAENMFQGTVGIFCVQSVNNSDSGGGAYPPSAVQAARFCEYYGMNAVMIDGGDILDHGALNNLDVLLAPGGYALQYKYHFSDSTSDPVRALIRDWVSNGGVFIGFCAGGFFGSDWVYDTAEGGSFDYYTDLIPGLWSIGAIEDLTPYPSVKHTWANIRRVASPGTIGSSFQTSLVWGPYFATDINGSQNFSSIGVTVHAVYDYEVSGQPGIADEKAAVISASFGSGKILLTGPHLCYEEVARNDWVNNRDWVIADEMDNANHSFMYDPDGTDWPYLRDLFYEVLPLSCKTTGTPNNTVHNTRALVVGGLSHGVRSVWPICKMLYKNGIQPYVASPYYYHKDSSYNFAQFKHRSQDSQNGFDLAVICNGDELSMDNNYNDSVFGSFLDAGGSILAIGGGARYIYDDCNFNNGAGQDLLPNGAEHGEESITFLDSTIGTGTHTAFFSKQSTSTSDGSNYKRHWEVTATNIQANYNSLAWTTSHVAAAGATAIAYLNDGGSTNAICGIKYPYSNGKIMCYSVDMYYTADNSDGALWNNDFTGLDDLSAPMTNSLNWLLDTTGSDTVAPTVTITNPTQGSTIGGTFTFSADATDNVAVDYVSFYIDATPVGTDSTAPYSVQIDTTGYTNGNHNFDATAYDTSGNSTNAATITADIDNGSSGNETICSGTVPIRSSRDCYFNVGGSGAINVVVVYTGTFKSITVEIYDNTDTLIASTSGNSPVTLNTSAAGIGQYRVNIYSKFAAIDYTCTVTHP